MPFDNEPFEPNARRWHGALLGFTAGLLNGLIALGGGILVTPYLVAERHVVPQVAVGTSLAVVVVLSCIGFAAHLAVGGLVLGPNAIGASVLGGMLGALLGAKLLAKLSASWMLLLFSAFVLLVASRLIIQGLGVGFILPETTAPIPLLVFVTLGGISGVLSGMFGVGGGALVLLALAAIYGTSVQAGLPIALALNVSNAAFGLVQHARAGRVLWPELQLLVPTALFGIAFGAWLALKLPADVLRVVFGGFFVFVGFRIGRQGWLLAQQSTNR